MKRRVEDTAKVEVGPPQTLQRVPHTASGVVQTTYSTQAIKSTGSEVGSLQQYPIQSNYVTMPSIATSIKTQSGGGLQGGAPHGGILVQPHIRHNKVSSGGGTPPSSGGGSQQQFQRLKVEDALSYLDQVKFKFGNQPQVYNDFLDIMKEFKSQCIDTPGVIARVSNLFKGYPELISGFNTFLPPGYKIEVQANDTGYSLQVSVSMASPLGGTTHHNISEIPPLVQTQPSVVVANQPPKTPTVYPSGGGGGGGGVVGGAAVVKPVGVSGGGGSGERGPGAGAPPPPPPPPPNHQTNQPVEFNHAINYVNKIKNRFQGQPDKYKRFLEILHTYQKEQRSVKEGGGGGASGKHLTEAEVYSQVAKLFEHQEDLLAEFGQFLPDATSHNAAALVNLSNKCVSSGKSGSAKYNSSGGSFGGGKGSPPGGGKGSGGCPTKRSASEVYPGPAPAPAPSHPVKRQKLQSLAPTLAHYAAFDNIKKTLRHQATYDNILRCIYLYNQEVISRTELMLLIGPILARYPDQVHWLREFVGAGLGAELGGGGGAMVASPPPPPPPPASAPDLHTTSSTNNNNNNNNVRPERPEPSTTDIDFSTCKRIGASYCALPKNHNHPKCSGRTGLCKEVLNDTWVSFPTWSEEATFVTSRKTQYEEYIYRCEDERFELDLVIECNAATIRVLDGVQRRMSRMSPEELAKFRLDDTLGGSSPTIHIRALKRIYGEKSGDIVEGLKKNPSVAVPLVLRRLKAKEIEWRQAQKGFNKIWREQNEKFYLKSLDHQGINFKQNDLKALRSKSLYNEIESAYDERHESGEEKGGGGGPHLVLGYRDRSVLDDAANLLIHHVKRQTTIHKRDKRRVKQLLRQFLPDMFHHPRQELSDDERDDDEKMDSEPVSKGSNGPLNNTLVKEEEEVKVEPMDTREDDRIPPHAISPYPDESYTLFFGNNNWYLFLRLHQILCDRLARMAERSAKIAEEEALNSANRKESTAVALRLKPNEHVEDCYSAMLEMVKSVLDCSMDPSTYEDTLRNMFGIHAYIGFTLDRVVSYALQQLVSEESCVECWELHLRERLRGGGGGPCRTASSRAGAEASYLRAATHLLAQDNCYKIYIYKRDCKLTIELLDTEGEEEGSVKGAGKWSAYVDRLVDPSEKLDPMVNVEDRERWGKAVYLRRNLRTWSQPKLSVSTPDDNSNPTNSMDGGKLEGCDETQCRVLNNEKLVYIVNKDSFLYRRQALHRARQTHNEISRRLYMRFRRWHSAWAEAHVTGSEREVARAWLMGLLPDTKPNSTVVACQAPLDTPPYHPFNRYRVKYPPTPTPAPPPPPSPHTS